MRRLTGTAEAPRPSPNRAPARAGDGIRTRDPQLGKLGNWQENENDNGVPASGYQPVTPAALIRFSSSPHTRMSWREYASSLGDRSTGIP